MNDNKRLKEILASKESKLIKKQAWLDEVGMDRLEDNKLAAKRAKVRREISELIFNIQDIKELIKGE
tara:strand:+ start:94 stop:294 length:201 start_codon:yes stop_codon:yes gene_type:complete